MEAGKTGAVRMPNNFDVHKEEQFTLTLSDAIVEAREVVKDVLPFVFKWKRLYFAGPWFDERSKQLYDACVKIASICDEHTPYDIFFPREQINPKPSDAFVKNVSSLQAADLVVALVSRKDCGTSWEIGMAYALNKPVILLGYDESTFLSHTNVMLAFTGSCATIKELARILCKKPYKVVTIKNEWEGIE